MQLEQLDTWLAVCRLDPDAPVPGWAVGVFTSVTRRRGELSIVCAAEGVPDGVVQEGPFAALVVRGPLAFDAVGVLAELTTPLAAAGIPILAIGTYDTDVVLVAEEHLDRARTVLVAAGHDLVGGGPG